ncbi:MAG: hypothetical protein K2X87_19245 [Gemmataceae bacterium]|nr:hypothetical protein [Gemmataceae bacterium]
MKKLFGIKPFQDEELGEVHRAKLTWQCVITPELMEGDPLKLAAFILMQIKVGVADRLAQTESVISDLRPKQDRKDANQHWNDEFVYDWKRWLVGFPMSDAEVDRLIERVRRDVEEAYVAGREREALAELTRMGEETGDYDKPKEADGNGK